MVQLSSFGGSNPGDKPDDPVAGKVPDSATVQRFHINADTDGDEGSIHHTLGPGKSQAAAGNHDHNGGNSVLILAGVTLTGAKAGNAALASVISALVQLGATDNTT